MKTSTDPKTIREIGGEVWAESWAGLSEGADANETVNHVIDILMGVLARYEGQVITNDPDLPVLPLGVSKRN